MEYKDFLQPFHNSNKEKSGLRGIGSQGDVARYFMELPFNGEVPDDFTYTPDTYRKWFTGPNKPKSKYWTEIEKIFDENTYKQALASKIDENNIREVAAYFDIESCDSKKILAEALTLQFKALINGKGKAEDIVKQIYVSRHTPSVYGEYIRVAIEQYEVMTLLGGDECTLEQGYVCNHISTRPEVFANNNVIEDATLEKLKTFDRRGIVKNVLLIGGNGIGKTLMLQHLFVESAKQYSQTGLLPIFVELREFSFDHRDIFDTVLMTVQNMDETFTREEAIKMLSAGRCQLLLDGVDEIDQTDIKDFQRKLMSFLKKYPDNQVVMTSRFCDAYAGIKGFVPLYILPFNSKQSAILIDLLLAQAGPTAKEKVYECIEKGFIKKDGAFVSNPMMLTFIIENYPKLDDFYGNRYLFYKEAYDAIVLNHDNDKTAYERIYRSVGSSDEFTDVFSEFCAVTYRQGVFQFDSASFEKFFKGLKSKDQVANPKILTAKAFQYDACSTACMMFESKLDIYYIDPGFQEYMFARYYAFAEVDEMKELGKYLQHMSSEKYGKWTAFEMLHEYAPEKTEIHLFLPLLDQIFKGKNDEDAFFQFITLGYEQINYMVLNKELIESFRPPAGIMSQVNTGTLNEPKTVILSVIYRILKEFNFVRTNVYDMKASLPDLVKYIMVGELVNAHFDGEQGEKLLLRAIPVDEFYDEQYEETHETSNLVQGDNGIVEFGTECCIKTSLLGEAPETYKDIVTSLSDDMCALRQLFNRVKNYYSEILEKQELNEYN